MEIAVDSLPLRVNDKGVYQKEKPPITYIDRGVTRQKKGMRGAEEVYHSSEILI